MHYGSRRILAWLIDWACILAWVAATAAIGIPLYLAGVITLTNAVALNIVGAVVVVIPVVLLAAWFESRSNPATPGKRALRLVVRSTAGRLAFGKTLSRNAIKIGLPWLVGHAAVFAIVNTDDPTAGMPFAVYALLVAAYLLPLSWIVSLFVGSGRTPYDRVSGTAVTDARALVEPRAGTGVLRSG